MKLLSSAANTGTLPLQAPGRTSGEGNRRVKQTGCAPVRVFLGLQPFEARSGPNKLAVSSPGQTQTIEGESKTISKVPVGAESVSGVAAAAASQSFLLLWAPPFSSSSLPCRLGFRTPSGLRMSSSFSYRKRRHFNPLVTITTTARAVSASAIITNNGYGDLGGGKGGGGEGRGGGGDNEAGGGEEEDSGIQKNIKMKLFLLRLLTLGYTALVGVGAAMGGTEKSALGGGVSILVLEYVFRNLPTKTTLASMIGLTISAAVGMVTLSRLTPWKRENIFPTGVVFVVSTIMILCYQEGVILGLDQLK